MVPETSKIACSCYLEADDIKDPDCGVVKYRNAKCLIPYVLKCKQLKLCECNNGKEKVKQHSSACNFSSAISLFFFSFLLCIFWPVCIVKVKKFTGQS